jgi:DNA-binding LacI/PurR family transcriptional regulator
MSKDGTNPTLEDIAVHSGVSIATVSRVLNTSGPVSKEAEERVKQAVENLGFTPRRKRRKAQVKSSVIACLVPEFLNPATTMILTGMQEEAEKMALHLLIVPVSEKPGSLRNNLNLLKHISLDGIILHHSGIELQEIFDLCHSPDMAMVVLRRSANTPDVHCIDSDRESGMFQATKLLIGMNHSRIAYLSGSAESESSQAKLQGIKRALAESNLILKPELCRRCLPTTDDGFRVTNNLLHLPVEEQPTAIIAYNDLVAVGALSAIRSAELSIPDDISVIGFDNIPLAPHTNPPLTTVAQPQYQKGQMAIQKLLSSLNGKEPDQEGVTLLECSLVVRESTGVCRKRELS